MTPMYELFRKRQPRQGDGIAAPYKYRGLSLNTVQPNERCASTMCRTFSCGGYATVSRMYIPRS